MTFTLVSFHAHPDDEALLTAGTMARATAEGHRVVLVVATAGEAGLAASGMAPGGSLGERRRTELEASAQALGCARLEVLGYPDSGMRGEAGGPDAFCRVPVDAAAARLAEILIEERADVLTTYDRQGGYGHPDHLRVHEVGRAAAALAGVPVVLEATVPRQQLLKALRGLSVLRALPADVELANYAEAFSDQREITHRVDVKKHLAAKRASMAAHASQATADEGRRTLQLCLRLPRPVFRRVFGQEWYVQRPDTNAHSVAEAGSGRYSDDIFASVR
jgi:LmbE family N-acetylglucosaminyl deacetylase